ncbi:MAG: hypothetical protein ACFHWX_08470 [Bacteroidota bacterium]
MNLQRIIIVALLLSHQLVFSQKKVKVEKKVRIIDYYILSQQENGGFFRKNQELPRILLEGVINGQLTAYKVDYLLGNERALSKEGLSNQLRKIDEPGNDTKYSPEDISLIGLDLTLGFKNEETFHHFNYINLYVPYHHSATTSNTYICSFHFDEVINLLNKERILWYPESFGFNLGIFTNYGGYSLEQTKWAKNLLEEVKTGFSGASFSESTNISTYNAYDGFPVDIHLKETHDKGYYIQDAVDLHKVMSAVKTGENTFICSIPIGEFREYLRNQKNSGAILMSEALTQRKLTSPSETWQNKYENFYDINFKDQKLISREGKFLESGHSDPLIMGNKLELLQNHNELTNPRFKVRQVESVDLSGKEYFDLRRVMKEILSAKIRVYTYDSLNRQLPDLHQVSLSGDIEQADLIYEITFDLEGNKSYAPLGVGIFTDDNTSSGYFRFGDFKDILDADLLDILIDRDFKGFIKKTSHISLAESMR